MITAYQIKLYETIGFGIFILAIVLVVMILIIAVCAIGGSLNKLDGEYRFFED